MCLSRKKKFTFQNELVVVADGEEDYLNISNRLYLHLLRSWQINTHLKSISKGQSQILKTIPRLSQVCQ